MMHLSSLMRRGPVAGLLLLLLWLAGPAARAQAPAWQAALVVGSGNTVVAASATDASGAIYLAGMFTQTVVFGSIALTSAGGSDAFVAKYSPATGQFVWAQRAGGTGSESATAVAVSNASVYLSGSFSSPTAGFGSLSLANTTPTSSADADVFVAKLTDGGTTSAFVWAQRAGGPGRDQARALAVSGAAVYVVGDYSSAGVDFGGILLGNQSPSGPAGTNVFVAKLLDAGASGSFAWAQRAGATEASGVAVSGANVYVTGFFLASTADFGSTVLTNTSSVYDGDGFVAKLTDAGTTGSFGWVQQLRGASFETVRAVAVSGTGVYVTGYFFDRTLALGATVLYNASPSTISDGFVAKLTDAGATGSFAWAQRFGGQGDDEPAALAVSGRNVYVAGKFHSPQADFGATTLANGTASANVFVAKLTDAGATGSFAWAQQASGPNDDVSSAITLSGALVGVAGYFLSTATFGSQALFGPTGTNASFLAFLPDPTLLATTAARGALPFTLAPNPARTAATLTLPAGPGAATATLTLTDALGRTLRTQPLPRPAASQRLALALDLTGLAPGLYAVRVQAGEATGTQRLVVE